MLLTENGNLVQRKKPLRATITRKQLSITPSCGTHLVHFQFTRKVGHVGEHIVCGGRDLKALGHVCVFPRSFMQETWEMKALI